MLVTLLIALTIVSAALHILAEYHGPKRNIYIFKPLTMVFIITIALQAEIFTSSFYKYMIIAGLSCSLVGDIFIMLPSDRFVPGLISFLIAHLFYIAAFTLGGARIFSFWYLIPLLLYGTIMLWILLPYLGKMKLPVLVYMLVILIMGWQALNRWIGTDQAGSGLAFLGALLFMASDSMLAVDRFKGHFRNAQLCIMSTYFAAQLLIALSIGVF